MDVHSCLAFIGSARSCLACLLAWLVLVLVAPVPAVVSVGVGCPSESAGDDSAPEDASPAENETPQDDDVLPETLLKRTCARAGPTRPPLSIVRRGRGPPAPAVLTGRRLRPASPAWEHLPAFSRPDEARVARAGCPRGYPPHRPSPARDEASHRLESPRSVRRRTPPDRGEGASRASRCPRGGETAPASRTRLGAFQKTPNQRLSDSPPGVVPVRDQTTETRLAGPRRRRVGSGS